MAEVPKKMLVTSELEKSLIFQSLLKLKHPIRVCIQDIEYPGYIEKIEDDGIAVRIDTPTVGSVEGTVKANFVFHSNYHYFASEARKLHGNLIRLGFPEQISKNMVRMYDRASVLGDAFMRFRILIRTKRQEFKGGSLLANERMILQELKKPRPAVDKILNGIRSLVSEFSQTFQFKVFKPGETLALDEQIVKETQKVFLIYDSFSDNIGEKRFLDDDVLTIGTVFERWIGKGVPKKNAESALLDLIDQKRKARVFSECLIPLLVEGGVVGCLKLSNDVDYHRSIKPAFAVKAAEYANVLVDALVKYDYFNLKSEEQFKIPVVNLSAGGLLFRLEESRLKGYISRGSILLVALQFEERQIRIRGIVYRIEEETSSYGVKFQEISVDDMNFIDDFVKRRGTR
jgi:hypothetical protein